MNDYIDTTGSVLIAVIALMVCVGIYAYGFSQGERVTREAAVRSNVAHWVADKDGKPEFKFKQ